MAFKESRFTTYGGSGNGNAWSSLGMAMGATETRSQVQHCPSRDRESKHEDSDSQSPYHITDVLRLGAQYRLYLLNLKSIVIGEENLWEIFSEDTKIIIKQVSDQISGLNCYLTFSHTICFLWHSCFGKVLFELVPCSLKHHLPLLIDAYFDLIDS
jgi:hypothetical protein